VKLSAAPEASGYTHTLAVAMPEAPAGGASSAGKKLALHGIVAGLVATPGTVKSQLADAAGTWHATVSPTLSSTVPFPGPAAVVVARLAVTFWPMIQWACLGEKETETTLELGG